MPRLLMIRQAEEAARVRRAHITREAIEVILLVAVIFFAIRLSLSNFYVSGTSMVPNFADNQDVMVNKLSYVFGSPQRGDVVILNCHALDATIPGNDCIKRVIGLPGDTIDITPTAVTVNGVTLKESYIAADINNTAEKITLGKNDYFVMGDNRPVSCDSRSFGPVPRDLIIGKATIVYWPLNSAHVINTFSDTYTHVPSVKPTSATSTNFVRQPCLP